MVKEKRYFAYFILLLLAPELAMANVALPMIVFTFPAMCIMLLAVIFIEYLVLKRRWPSINKKSLIFDISIGNFFSTLLGVPIAWLIYYYGITEPVNKYFSKIINNLSFYLIYPLEVLIYAPLIYGSGVNIYVNFILTLFPTYYLSYWIEYFFVNQDGISKEETLCGIRYANRVSYLFVLIVATIYFLILSNSEYNGLLGASWLWIREKGMVFLFLLRPGS